MLLSANQIEVQVINILKGIYHAVDIKNVVATELTLWKTLVFQFAKSKIQATRVVD